MKNREELIEQYEDALFTLLMYDIAQAEGEEALKLNELLKNDPHAALPESLQRRCKRTIRNAFAKQSVKRAGRTAGKVIQRISVAAILAVLLLTTACAVSEGFRIAILNTVIQVFDNRTRITFERSASSNGTNKWKNDYDYNCGITLDWLPEGYEFETGESNRAGDYVSFVSPKDGLIEVSVVPFDEGMVYNVNSEDCTMRSITVHGLSANLYIVNEGMLHKRYANMPQIWSDMQIYWIDTDNQVIVHISGTNLDEDGILRLAEGVHWENKF